MKCTKFIHLHIVYVQYIFIQLWHHLHTIRARQMHLQSQTLKKCSMQHELPFSMIILSIGYPATGHLRKNVFPATADNFGIGLTYGIPVDKHWNTTVRQRVMNSTLFYIGMYIYYNLCCFCLSTFVYIVHRYSFVRVETCSQQIVCNQFKSNLP